jgi:hypothetical protein
MREVSRRPQNAGNCTLGTVRVGAHLVLLSQSSSTVFPLWAIRMSISTRPSLLFSPPAPLEKTAEVVTRKSTRNLVVPKQRRPACEGPREVLPAYCVGRGSRAPVLYSRWLAARPRAWVRVSLEDASRVPGKARFVHTDKFDSRVKMRTRDRVVCCWSRISR